MHAYLDLTLRFRSIAGMMALVSVSVGTTLAMAVVGEAAAPPIPIGDADGDGDVDLDDLVKRIRDSKAIGLLTKLSLKREIERFERDLQAFYDGVGKSTLAELHERYDLLVHKLVTLLQGKDPGLARDISRARDPLWAKLTDADEVRRL